MPKFYPCCRVRLLQTHQKLITLKVVAIMRLRFKMKDEHFCPAQVFETWSPGTERKCATNELPY